MRRWVAAALAASVLSSCASTQTPDVAPTITVPEQHDVLVTKLLVFVVENHSLDQMREGMPFTFGLAQRYGYALNYKAIRHPSLPNYLAIAGGSTFGVDDDNPPADHPISGESVFGQALSLGKAAKVYADAMDVSCQREDDTPYAVRHNPWAYFVDEHDSCARYDVSLDALAPDVSEGRLPNAGMVVPDLCNDAHDCDLDAADGFIRQQVKLVMSGPDWKSGHLMVVITADEDDHNQDNTVLTTVAFPALSHVVTDAALNHYSLTRLYDEVLGAPPLRKAAVAPSLLKAFGLHQTG